MLLRLTLRQLSIFVAVARTGSATWAARQLFLSQSAVSMALADLELALGKPLFERIHKTLRLNYDGERLLPKAMAILEQAGALSQVGNDTTLVGTLKVAASSTIGNYLLPARFQAFYRLHPKVQVVSRIANTQTIIESLLKHETDIGFIEGYCHEPSLVSHPWLTDELCLCVSPTHPLASQAVVNHEDLANAAWILREPGSGTRAVFEHAITGRIQQLNVVMELSSSEAIKAVVREGVGVGCLSKHVVQDDLTAQRLINLPVDLPLQRQFSWLVPSQRMASPLLLAWFELLKS